jgi:hypothetical protein
MVLGQVLVQVGHRSAPATINYVAVNKNCNVSLIKDVYAVDVTVV